MTSPATEVPATFKALRIHQVDKKTEARLEAITLADLSAGQVVIRVAYSSINYKDALAVTGKGRIMRGYPKVAGIDLSGIVVSSEVPDYKPGDKVVVTGGNVGEQFDGGFAEYARVPAEAVVRLPAGLSLHEAMALGTAGYTAALALRRMLENHQRPDLGTIAVTGPTGGVGSIAISLFKRAGFTVAAITGKPGAEKYLRDLGADEIVDRNTLDMGSKPLEAARWGGAVDNLGGDTLAYLARTVKPWGSIGAVGLAQAPTLNTTVIPFILRGVSLLGIFSVECPRSWRLAIWERLASDWKPEGLLSLIAPKTVPLEEVATVAEELVAGKAQGRTVVRIADDL
ncbi:YhdH/YhfP family quinone oxidoreductase [uncultured Nevskia sp.]|uniref:YhdH/YhfP family quinone oxidoreductase n=1 Tax=uncultured Nevskia sp. TaxID=228950 RepID=UPI0025D63AB3|nr:YhdH/YhfP family quinone oxidoreductase [uncultured Nevskia sp.]